MIIENDKNIILNSGELWVDYISELFPLNINIGINVYDTISTKSYYINDLKTDQYDLLQEEIDDFHTDEGVHIVITNRVKNDGLMMFMGIRPVYDMNCLGTELFYPIEKTKNEYINLSVTAMMDILSKGYNNIDDIPIEERIGSILIPEIECETGDDLLWIVEKTIENIQTFFENISMNPELDDIIYNYYKDLGEYIYPKVGFLNFVREEIFNRNNNGKMIYHKTNHTEGLSTCSYYFDSKFAWN